MLIEVAVVGDVVFGQAGFVGQFSGWFVCPDQIAECGLGFVIWKSLILHFFDP